MGNKQIQVDTSHRFEIYTHKVKNDGSLATRKELERRKRMAEMVQNEKSKFNEIKQKIEDKLITKNFFIQAKKQDLGRRKMAILDTSASKKNGQDENQEYNLNTQMHGLKTPIKSHRVESFNEEDEESQTLKSKELALQKSQMKHAKSNLRPIEESDESFNMEDAAQEFAEEMEKESKMYSNNHQLQNLKSLEQILAADEQAHINTDLNNIIKQQPAPEKDEDKDFVQESLVEKVDKMIKQTVKSSFATRFGETIAIDHPDLNNELIGSSAKKKKSKKNKPEIQMLNLTDYLKTNTAATRTNEDTLSSRSRRYTKTQIECYLKSLLEVCQRPGHRFRFFGDQRSRLFKGNL